MLDNFVTVKLEICILLTARSLQASCGCCNDRKRRFPVYFLENWVDLDRTQKGDAGAVLGKKY